jgi:hypothetical protein
MNQQLKDGQDVSASTPEVDTTQAEVTTPVETTTEHETTTEKVTAIDPKVDEKTKAQEFYQARKEKELEKYKKQVEALQAEKEKYERLATNPPREGEVYSHILEQNVPINLSHAEYDRLILEHTKQKNDEYVKQQFVKAIDDTLQPVLNKYKDAEQLLTVATQTGILNRNMFLSVADPTAGGTSENVEFIYKLVKNNPEELQAIASISSPVVQARKMGELMAKYKDKPEARISNADTPIKPINEAGSINPTSLLNKEGDQGFRARKQAYLNKMKRR